MTRIKFFNKALIMKKKLPFLGLIISSLFYSQTSNTQTRDDAGAPTVISGFYQTNNPINYPPGASIWWHLLDVRHTNSANNYGMQFAGSFFDQDLWFRKTNNNSSQVWKKVVMATATGNVGIGTAPSNNLALNVKGSTEFTSETTTGDSFHFFNFGNNVAAGTDLMWLSYKNYQSQDVGLLTLSAPPTLGDWSKPVFTVRANGKVLIGTSWNNAAQSSCNDCNDYKLFVKDGIRTEKVKVDVGSTTGWADYVFKKDYKLRTLEEVEKHIIEKGHLPNIPSANEVVKNGVNLGEMDAKLLEKIEELTLYSIEQNKQIKKLQQENETLQQQSKKIDVLEKQIQEFLSSKE